MFRGAIARARRIIDGATMKRLFFHAVLLAIALCVALYVSSTALLIHSSTPKASGGSQGFLLCRYFTGTDLIQRTHDLEPAGGAKKLACQRIISMDK